MIRGEFVEKNLPQPSKHTYNGNGVATAANKINIYTFLDLAKLKKAVSEIEKDKIDITDNYEDEWIEGAGFPLARMGEPGRDYFHRISQFNPGYDEHECDKKFDNLVTQQRGVKGLGSFFELCKKYNIDFWPDNAFPADSFPEDIQKIIEATNRDLNFPVDYMGGSILVAAATAIGNTHVIKVKPGYLDHAILWMALVGPPGANKTHPVTFVLKPIKEGDKVEYREYKRELERYEALKGANKKQLQEAGETEKPKAPKLKITIVSDTTQEALADIMDNNPRGGLSHNDELAGWFHRFNRYNTGGELEFWLSLWSAQRVIITRKNAGNHIIDSPFMCVLGTMQNGVLKELGKDNKSHNGFKDRILFAFPDKAPKPVWSETELADWVEMKYFKIMTKLQQLEEKYNSYGDELEPAVVSFSPEAKQKVFAWQKENTRLCNEVNDEGIKSIYTKIETYAMRIALTLHLLHFACGEAQDNLTISVKVWEKTERLAEYFRQTALKAHTLIKETDPTELLEADVFQFYQALPDKFEYDEGWKVAGKLKESGTEIGRSKYKRFLKIPGLFNKLKRGLYEKN